MIDKVLSGKSDENERASIGSYLQNELNLVQFETFDIMKKKTPNNQYDKIEPPFNESAVRKM